MIPCKVSQLRYVARKTRLRLSKQKVHKERRIGLIKVSIISNSSSLRL